MKRLQDTGQTIEWEKFLFLKRRKFYFNCSLRPWNLFCFKKSDCLKLEKMPIICSDCHFNEFSLLSIVERRRCSPFDSNLEETTCLFFSLSKLVKFLLNWQHSMYSNHLTMRSHRLVVKLEIRVFSLLFFWMNIDMLSIATAKYNDFLSWFLGGIATFVKFTPEG